MFTLGFALFLIAAFVGLTAVGLIIIAFNSKPTPDHNQDSRYDSPGIATRTQGGVRNVHVRPLPEDSRMDKRTIRDIQRQRTR